MSGPVMFEVVKTMCITWRIIDFLPFCSNTIHGHDGWKFLKHVALKYRVVLNFLNLPLQFLFFL